MTHPTIALEAAFAAGPAGGPWMTLDDVSRGVLDTAKLADDSLGTGFWSDLGDRADRVTVKRGRQRLLDRSEPGRMTAELDNDDRELDPTNLNGTFVAGGRSLVKPMRPVRLRATHPSGPITLLSGNSFGAAYDAAWDTDDLDIELVVSGLHASGEATQTVIRRGGSPTTREWFVSACNGLMALAIFETPGTASHFFAFDDFLPYTGNADVWTVRITLDTDDGAGGHLCTFTATNGVVTVTQTPVDTLFGATAPITLPNVAAATMHIGVPGSAGLIEVFGGKIHAVTVFDAGVPIVAFRASDWDPAGGRSSSPVTEWTAATYTGGDTAVATVTDEVYDLFRGYADNWLPEWREPDDSICFLTATDGFKVFARVDRNASSPAGAGETTGARIGRILDHAEWADDDRDLDTGISTVQATTLAQNALTELYLTADTERGELFIDGQGHVVFRDRHHRYTDPHSLFPRWVLGNADGELQCVLPQPETDDEVLVNRAEIGRVGGTVQTAEDAASIEEFLLAQMSRADLLMETDDEAAAYAATVVQLLADHDLRFDSVVLEPSTDDLLWPVVLGAEIGNRLTIRWTPPGGGDRIVRDVFIEGIEHEFNVASTGDVLDWRTTFRLSDAERWEWFVLDSGAYGVLDTNRLGY